MEAQRTSSPFEAEVIVAPWPTRNSHQSVPPPHMNITRESVQVFHPFVPQGSADEDSDRSLQDLTSLNHSGDLSFGKKKLSSRSDFTVSHSPENTSYGLFKQHI